MRPKRPGGYGSRGSNDSDIPSSNLWVGNLPLDITEPELTELFEKHGLIDEITCYASRSYAFVYFKRVEDATSAKDSLQGFLIRGNPIKIEFAKPAKPSKHVWVGGFGSSVTKEQLEEELSKFGKIEEFKFIRDRNTALVDFLRVEDASAAVKNLNGLQIGGDRIRVDYLRSHPARREQSDFHEMGGAQFRGMGGMDLSWTNPDNMRNFPEPTFSGHKRPQPSQSFGGRKSGQPSKVLWVGYPNSVVIDEEMLHNAMILYGEIERIKCFPSRHYAFVDFRSVEEARRAKEALQGRLFNDPRITIMFSNSDLAPGKDFSPAYPGYRGQGPDMFRNEVPFRPPMMDIFPSNHGMPPNNFSGPPAPNGLLRPGPRPFGPRGSMDPLRSGPEFSDSMSDLTNNASTGLNRRKLSPPAPGLLPTPGAPGRTSHKTSGWDVLDPNQLPRESKRSRIDGPALYNDPPLITGKGDEYPAGVDQPYGTDPQFMGGPPPKVHADSGLGPADMGVAKGWADEEFIWRGVIAKGGTPVCRARCIPMGKGLECELPEVVNCSARTGLDMLAKHYAGAIGFDIVFFLPDSEDDFANYTEFLRYLGSKDRAGVAKLDDGTTLFLVPPSEFLTDVLKVAGPERLYGVVLRLPQQIPGASAPQPVHQPLPPMQHMESQLAPPPHEYVAPTPKREMTIQMDYGRPMPAETTMPPKSPFPAAAVPQNQSSDSNPSTSLPAVTLTPELIATLASLIPSNAQAPLAQSAQPQLSSSAAMPSFPVTTTEKGAFFQTHQPQVVDQSGQLSQQFSGQQSQQFSGQQSQPFSGQPSQQFSGQQSQPFSGQPSQQFSGQPTQQFSGQPSQQFSGQPYPNTQTGFHQLYSSNNLNANNHPVQVHPESLPMQNPVYNLHDQGSIPSRSPSIQSNAASNQQYMPSSQGTQPHHFEAPHNIQKGYGMMHGVAAGSYGVTETQQSKHPVSYSNQLHGANLPHSENVLPTSSGNVNVVNQPEKLPQVPSGVGQGTAEVGVDKNQRYHSTLQFAANLLLQIQQQQQQQQSSSHMGNQQ